MAINKTLVTVGIVVIILIVGILIIGGALAGTYNNMVNLRNTAETQWAQVENAYQRKYDLIPNLVSVAKNYAEFEQETLTNVVEARAKATSINIDAENITAEQLQQFEQAQQQLNSSLGRLIATFERYPDLKANQNYLKLQDELVGSENRIATERMRYNEQVLQYNNYIDNFPQHIIAPIYGFENMPPYNAEAAAEGGKVDVEELFNE